LPQGLVDAGRIGGVLLDTR
ncbi:hypothetical protein TNCV_4487991, partial [Trichonephila clavipes]